jgi:hypothetical protein
MTDIEDKVALANALTNSAAAASIAVAGVVAICNELAASGALDDDQINRIRAFMLVTTERGPGTQKLQSHVNALIHQHFDHLSNRMS